MALIYNGLGFPIKLEGVKTREFRGEVLPDINHRELEDKVFHSMLWSHFQLTGAQLAFVRGYMGLSQKEIAKTLGLKTHATISGWESKDGWTGMSHVMEVVIRLLMADYIREAAFAPHFKEFLDLRSPAQEFEPIA
jgi:DNA-binding transcriptional regulator YiaG